MKHHSFSPRAAAAAAVAGMAVLLAGGTATGAMAAVTSVSAPSAAQGTPTVPGAPTAVSANPGSGNVALTWAAPSSDGAVTGYHVYMGFSPSFTATREFTTTGTSFRLNDAENGSTYFIKVTALNAAGEGPATPVAASRTATATASTGAPGRVMRAPRRMLPI